MSTALLLGEQVFCSLSLPTSQAVVAHSFSPSTQEAEAGRSLSSRLAWATEEVPGQPELHTETLSQRMAQGVRYLLCKPSDLSLSPRPRMKVEGENQLHRDVF